MRDRKTYKSVKMMFVFFSIFWVLCISQSFWILKTVLILKGFWNFKGFDDYSSLRILNLMMKNQTRKRNLVQESTALILFSNITFLSVELRLIIYESHLSLLKMSRNGRSRKRWPTSSTDFFVQHVKVTVEILDV